MVKILINGTQFVIDGYLKENMDTAKTVVKKDWDMLFCVDGMEGSGKSVLAMQLAYYLDPTLNMSRIVFNPAQFKRAILTAEKYQAIVYDEAYTGLSARAAMTLINRTLVSMLAEIRQKNLFVFIVMPCFFDLDKYVALWRSRALIHVYTGDNFQRGFMAFYNVDAKKRLFILGKKFYSYGKPRPNFICRFTDQYVVDKKEYKLAKLNALNRRADKAEKEALAREMRDVLFERLEVDKVLKEKIPNIMKARIMGISEVHYYRLMKDYNELKEFRG